MARLLRVLPLLLVSLLLVGCNQPTVCGKRGGDEVLPISYWITPSEPAVESVVAEHALGINDYSRAVELYSYVTNLEFTPEAEGEDYWQLPYETISIMGGDCEDKAFLLHSLFLAAELDTTLVIGKYDDNPHSWVECEGYLFEVTNFSFPRKVEAACYEDYQEELRFIE